MSNRASRCDQKPVLTRDGLLPVRRCAVVALLVVVLMSAVGAGSAWAASVALCVPSGANAAVVSPGSGGTCASGVTKVALPASSADQQTLLSILPHLRYAASGIGGKPTITFTGVNEQVVSGSGKTNGTVNGVGNLVIGYDETPGVQTGSHNLILGTSQSFQSYGGLLAGSTNTIAAPYAAVVGGAHNTAGGTNSAVTGGYDNHARATYATVSGGGYNIASDKWTSVTGGGCGIAGPGTAIPSTNCTGPLSAQFAAVTGGQHNTATGPTSTVTGGFDNIASASSAAVNGGAGNTASGWFTAVTGGYANAASNECASVTGGDYNKATGTCTAILGGSSLTLPTDYGTYPYGP